MRNYFKMRGLWVHGQEGLATAELVAWAGTDEGLLEWIQPQIDTERQTFPNMVFTYHGPFTVWFLLNEENFARILNGPSPLLTQHYALAVWENVRLPSTGVGNGIEFFYDTTANEVQGSPRKTWSHGH